MVHFLHEMRPILTLHCPLKAEKCCDICRVVVSHCQASQKQSYCRINILGDFALVSWPSCSAALINPQVSRATVAETQK